MSDTNLVFGVFAVQLGSATPAQVMAAASAWMADKSLGLPERLEQSGALTTERRKMLEGLVAEALRANGGDAAKTLATVGGNDALFRSFGGTLSPAAIGALSQSLTAPEEDEAVTNEQPGHYTIKSEHGRGGQSRVYLVVDEHIGREVALKQLLPEVPQPGAENTPRSGTTSAAIRFLREARITGRLEHPNIVPVYELGRRTDGSHYYTQKLVRGETLRKKLGECKALPDRLKLLGHFLDVCQAMAYAHSRSVIHRDLKPDNIMIGEFGETVVLDWGLAKVKGQKDILAGGTSNEAPSLEGHPSVTVEGHALGTPSYMSPEQALGKLDEVDERSDVWSLGAILYEILTGGPPFTGETAFEVIGKVIKEPITKATLLSAEAPRELIAISERALERKPLRRYPSAKVLATEVEAYQSGGRVASYEYSSWELARRFVAKNRGLSAVAVVSSSLLIFAFGLILLSARRANTERDRANREAETANMERNVSEQRQQELALQRARLLKETDPLAALEAIGKLEPDQPGWGDARLLAEEIRDNGLPVWRLDLLGAAGVMRRNAGGLWVSSGVGRIWSLDPGTGNIEKLPDAIHGTLLAASLSAPLIVTEDEGALRTYDVATGREVGKPAKTRRAGGIGASNSAYRSVTLVDGPALVAWIEGEGLVHIDPVTGIDELLAPGDTLIERPIPSKDGERILYAAAAPDKTNEGATAAGAATRPRPAPVLWIWSRVAGKRPLRIPADVARDLSPDGTMVAWVGKGRAHLEDLEGRTLAESTLAHARDVTFDAARKWLAVVGADGLELIDLALPTAAHHLIPLPEATSATFNDSGSELAVTSSGTAWVVDVQSGRVERTVHRPGLTGAWLFGTVLVTQSPEELLGWTPAAQPPLIDLGNRTLDAFWVAPSGRNWLTTTDMEADGRKERHTLLWNADTGKSRPFASDVFSSGDTLAWKEEDLIHVETLSPGGGSYAHKVARAKIVGAVSDAGALWLEDEAGESFLVAPGSDNERPVHFPPGVVMNSYANVKPCGALGFMALASDDKLYNIDVETGSARALVDWDSRGWIACAPDSAEFALGSLDRAPMLGNLDRPGQLTPLLPDTSARGIPFLGPRGARGLWDNDGGLRLASGIGQFSYTALKSSRAVGGESFSPDGQRLCFADGGNLWLAAVDGQTPRQLASSTSRGYFSGCGFVSGGRLVAGSTELIDSTVHSVVHSFADDLSTEPRKLVEELRSWTRQQALPIDTSPSGVAQRALSESSRLALQGRYAKANALIDAALELNPPSLETKSILYRNRAVLALRSGDNQTGVKYLRLYQPFAKPEEREQVEQLIEKYGPKKNVVAQGASRAATPAKEMFHYRSSARNIAVGEAWTVGLNGNLPTHYADAVRFDLPEAGALKLTTDCDPSRVAVLVYTSGRKPLAQARAGGTLRTPVVKGEVFVVIRALEGSGPVKVKLISAFEAAAPGTLPESPTTDATVVPDLEVLMAGILRSKSLELPSGGF